MESDVKDRENAMNVYDFDGTIYDGDSTVDFLKSVTEDRSVI